VYAGTAVGLETEREAYIEAPLQGEGQMCT